MAKINLNHINLSTSRSSKLPINANLYILVKDLPEKGRRDKIYLVKDESAKEGNIYNEYSFINGAWESLGQHSSSIEDNKGIMIVDSLDKAQNIETGQLFCHYRPNTAYSDVKLYEVGAALGDEDGFLLDPKNAKRIESFSLDGSLNKADWRVDDGMIFIDTIIELVFATEDIRLTFKFSYDTMSLIIDAKEGNIDSWGLSAGMTEYINAYFVSYTRKKREHKYDGTYDITTVEKEITADNYLSERSELKTYLNDVISFSGGTSQILKYYSQTPDGSEEFGKSEYAGMPIKDDSNFIWIVDYEAYLEPNVYYYFGRVPQLYISFAVPKDTSVINEYICEFTSESNGCTLSLPGNIKWANGISPDIEPDTTYQLSVVNNLGVITKFS